MSLVPLNWCLVLANTAVPGPVVLFGISNTGLGWAWLIGSMLVCVGVEGLIYWRFRCFAHPWRASLLLNTISAVLGLPATLCGLIFTAASEPVIGPTLATIAIEGWALWLARRAGCAVAAPAVPSARWGRNSLLLLITANLLSNAILYGALLAAFDAFPTPTHTRIVCMMNRSEFREAAQQFLEDHRDRLAQHIGPEGIAPYLQGGPRQCPAGGVYRLNLVDMEPTCSIHGSNANPIRDDREQTGMGWPLAIGLCAAGTVLSARLLLWKGPRQDRVTDEKFSPSGLEPRDSRRQ